MPHSVWITALALVAVLAGVAVVPALVATMADRWLWWFEHPDDGPP